MYFTALEHCVTKPFDTRNLTNKTNNNCQRTIYINYTCNKFIITIISSYIIYNWPKLLQFFNIIILKLVQNCIGCFSFAQSFKRRKMPWYLFKNICTIEFLIIYPNCAVQKVVNFQHSAICTGEAQKIVFIFIYSSTT